MRNKMYMAFILLVAISCFELGKNDVVRVVSPNGDYSFVLGTDKGIKAVYSIGYLGKEIVGPSVLGLAFNGRSEPLGKVILSRISTDSVIYSWKPIYGERNEYPDVYTESLVRVQRGEPSTI